jgi:aspartyl-tRNA(Asn)/glutamyl-tRNA(Gln) amidotransferase subunit C
MDTLAKLDLSGVEPTSHALPVYDVVRPDEARPGFTQAQTLSNAPKSVLDQFQIPKVIE